MHDWRGMCPAMMFLPKKGIWLRDSFGKSLYDISPLDTCSLVGSFFHEHNSTQAILWTLFFLVSVAFLPEEM
jgi:hypothetical protein